MFSEHGSDNDSKSSHGSDCVNAITSRSHGDSIKMLVCRYNGHTDMQIYLSATDWISNVD